MMDSRILIQTLWKSREKIAGNVDEINNHYEWCTAQSKPKEQNLHPKEKNPGKIGILSEWFKKKLDGVMF